MTTCAGCGAPRPPDERCASAACRRPDRCWSVAWAVGAHHGPMRRAVVDLKYRSRTGMAAVLAATVTGWLERNAGAVEEFDLIVPVPGYLGPGARRRFDPVGLVAAEVGRQWPVVPALAKVTETPAVTGRSREERQRIAAGPLRASLRVARPDLVAGRRVLVLDDVMSSGATMTEAARALVAAGVDEVAGIVLTRATLRPAAGTGEGAP